MTENQTQALEVKELVQKLDSPDPQERMAAREKLTSIGDSAVAEIVQAFQSDRRQIRWEAAHCLRLIGSSKAIPALIKEIEEPDSDVGWLAAEALLAAGESSVVPVLKSLTSNEHEDLGHLYNHAHHILRSFACYEKYQNLFQPLLNAFDESEPQIGVPVKAYEALQLLKNSN